MLLLTIDSQILIPQDQTSSYGADFEDHEADCQDHEANANTSKACYQCSSAQPDNTHMSASWALDLKGPIRPLKVLLRPLTGSYKAYS